METPCCGSLSGLWLYFGITVIRKENPLNERFWAVLLCSIVFSYSAKEVVLTCEFKTELSRTWSIKWHWAMQQKSSLVLLIKNWSPSKISPLVPMIVVSSFLSRVVYYASWGGSNLVQPQCRRLSEKYFSPELFILLYVLVFIFWAEMKA